MNTGEGLETMRKDMHWLRCQTCDDPYQETYQAATITRYGVQLLVNLSTPNVG